MVVSHSAAILHPILALLSLFTCAFAHAAWRVWSKAEEVTKDIILVRCFLDLSSSIPSSALRRRGWTLLVIISDDMLVAGWVNHGLSLLHVSNRRH